MTDRELLELAAKAAGYEIDEIDDNGNLFLKNHRGLRSCIWIPLNDDGDVLRLAVDMGFEIKIGVLCTRINGALDGQDDIAIVRHGGDDDAKAYAATRRAIVLAAAEIGKEMK